MWNLRNCFEANQCIDCNMLNYKNRHPSHDLPQTCMGANLYVQFGYGPLKIYKHTRVHLSLSMNNGKKIWYTQVNNQQNMA